MKYYLYVSDAKLEMLYGQIPIKMRDKIAVELKIDLKVIGATISESSRRENRYSQLALVTKYIQNNMPVGTPAEPAAYFMGTLPMRWGAIMGPSPGKIVYFGGKEGDLRVGLAGSRHHVVGFRGEGTIDTTPYQTPGLGSGFVSDILRQLDESLAAIKDTDSPNLERVEQSDLRTVCRTIEGLLGPVQRLEFLAKSLLLGQLPSSNPGKQLTVVLGSPLYVALAD